MPRSSRYLRRLLGARAVDLGPPGRYLPVRKPRASAQYGTHARPARGAQVGQRALVVVALDQAVVRLERDVARESLAIGGLERLAAAAARVVRSRRCA